MNARVRKSVLAAATLLAIWQLAVCAQPTERADAPPSSVVGSRFNFDILESYDAKYLGDTPGHGGRGGGLGNTKPNVALGDPVYNGDQQIGRVTSAVWDRLKGSLTIELEPVIGARIAVGDAVWLNLTPAAAPKKSK